MEISASRVSEKKDKMDGNGFGDLLKKPWPSETRGRLSVLVFWSYTQTRSVRSPRSVPMGPMKYTCQSWCRRRSDQEVTSRRTTEDGKTRTCVCVCVNTFLTIHYYLALESIKVIYLFLLFMSEYQTNNRSVWKIFF